MGWFFLNFYSNLLFLFGCINFINKRSENTYIFRPNTSLAFGHADLVLLFYIHDSVKYFIQVISRQALNSILRIGGVEPNPGPTSTASVAYNPVSCLSSLSSNNQATDRLNLIVHCLLSNLSPTMHYNNVHVYEHVNYRCVKSRGEISLHL